MSHRSLVTSSLLLSLLVACGGNAQVGAPGGAGNLNGAPTAPIGGGGASSRGGSTGGPATAGAPALGGSPSAGEAGNAGINGCVDGDQTYPVGATWACDCNTCGCDADGRVWTTEVQCTACTYAGVPHFSGETFRAVDGCNHCHCEDKGFASCTEGNCACDATKDWGSQYFTHEECSKLETSGGLACPANTEPLLDQCGCGCAQDIDCPEWIACGPGGPSCAVLKEQCPFSKIAL